MLTDNSFEYLADELVVNAEQLTLELLLDITRIAEQFIDNPDFNPDIRDSVLSKFSDYIDKARKWTDEKLAKAYIRGIEHVNGQIQDLGIDRQPEALALGATGIFVPAGAGIGNIPPGTSELFDGYQNHLTMYDVFRGATLDDLEQSRLPIVRDVQDKVRDLVIEASGQAYRSADDFTRRQLTQDIIDKFAKDNITGVQYADGRTMKLDTYAEMVARTQTGNAARQAQLNRLREFGHDLVRMTIHYPCSDLCIDWQGGVYSQSGQSEQYPSLATAISGGAFHPNCKHSLGGYFPGTSPAREERIDKRENAKQYEAQKMQRYNERQIRYWKRREATAITDQANTKAKAKIREWQAKQRDLVSQNSFLRRKYARESIN